MLINSLYLENIKSYEQADVSFAEGTNAICGPNGAGKSTLIEAVGFALFSSQRVKLEQLLRSGTAHGKIEVRFTSSLDGLIYFVTRDLRRTGASSTALTSDDLGAAVATGVRDVYDQLVQHLGLRPGVKLPSLFEGVVGVPQGQLTFDFLLPPTARKARFEELLALQEFELAHQRLSGPMSHGREAVASMQATLRSMDAQLRALPEAEQRLADIEARIEATKNALAAAEHELADVRRRRLAMDEDQGALAVARDRLSREESAHALEDQKLAEAGRRLHEATQAAALADGAAAGHARFIELRGAVSALEADVQARDDLRQRHHALESQVARLSETVKACQRQLDEARQARERLEELAPLARRQAELEQARQEARQSIQALRAARDQLQRLLPTQDGHVRQERDLGRQIAALQDDAAKRAKLLAARDKVTDLLAGVRATLMRVLADIEAQKAAVTAVARGESRACPACDRPFEGGDVQAFLSHLNAQLAEKEDEAADLELRLKRLEGAARRVGERLRRAEASERQSQALQAKLQATRALLVQVGEQVAELEGQSAPLPEQEESLRRLDADLAALGDPRTEHLALRQRVEASARYEREAEQARNAVAAVEPALAQIAGQLSALADLDARLAAVRLERERLRTDYEAYQRYAPLAEELPQRQQEAARQQRLVDKAERGMLEARALHESLASAYDAQAHAALRQHEQEQGILAAESRTQLSHLGDQLDLTKRRLGELVALRDDAADLRQRCQGATSALATLRVLREAVRLAGPEIAKRILARVSQSANRMFAEMMTDYATELEWRSDYGITLRRGPHESDFGQLSGGEQMTAALAVRLALLREISDVGVAFFDEPTVNLDEERRQSLAEQIRGIKDFQQLFVISHDDSLEGVTDNVIHVLKQDGASVVEQG